VREIKIKNLKVKIALPIILFLGFFFLFGAIKVLAVSYLTGGSLTLSDSRPSATAVSYTVDFDNVTTSAIKCMKIQFNTQADGAGSVPTGLSSAGTYNAAISDFVPDVQTWVGDTATAGTIKITNVTGETPASPTDRTVVVDGLTNGSTAGIGYYAIFTTYGNTDCTTTGVDSGTVSFIFTTGQAVSLTVDPSIAFTVSAVGLGSSVNGAATTVASTTSTIPLGAVTVSNNARAAHDLAVTTNAGSGYTVNIQYTAKPTSGSNDIDDHSGDHTTPSTMSNGTEAFGYTTEDTTYSGFQTNKYAKFTTSGLAVANNTIAVNNEITRVGYQAGISGTTPAGTYLTTVVLTCTPAY
jgi:hypothetical protein